MPSPAVESIPNVHNASSRKEGNQNKWRANQSAVREICSMGMFIEPPMLFYPHEMKCSIRDRLP